MRCKKCGATLVYGVGEAGLLLECERCAYPASVCGCRSRFGYTPGRWVHCIPCDRLNIKRVDTTEPGWRDQTV